ncbi:MAG: amino acid adenylation domain-containing protein [Eubacteriales bacterium]|nr:amino acid adenylation domain-containing protein [Eubacteriales bacterium]
MILFNGKIEPNISQKANHIIDEIIKVFKTKENIIVTIILERTPLLLSIIKALFDHEIAFVPIDKDFPKERIKYILENSETNIIITQLKNMNMSSYYESGVIDDITIYSRKNEVYSNKSQKDIAYILYTSGSTGKPKGVEINRYSLINFIEGISEIIDFSPQKRIACITTVSFDIFFLESIMAIYKGLSVVLANEDEQRNPKLMAKFIKDNMIDMIQMTPSRMQLLLNHDKELSCLKNVKEIMIGGEPFPLSLLRTLQEKTTAKIYNMYGPTETTVWSTVSDLTHKDRIDIGRPIKNTEVYIVDESLSILPNGQTGEICIAGEGLAKGYVGRDDLTAEKFIYLHQKPDVRVYRTGDMGRYLPDDELEYLGRTDNQVKIRGHRIELEEIESYLNQIDGIKQSVVIALETSETDKVLEALFTSDVAFNQKDISDYLSSKLPEYMIPAIFKRVEGFIQTVNGKIDRKRVLECVEINVDDSMSNDSAASKLNDTQKKAFEVIISTLDSKIGDLTLKTSFTGAGVDSITFIKIVIALESEFDFEFDDEMLLITKFATIKSMIDYVELKNKITNCENA